MVVKKMCRFFKYFSTIIVTIYQKPCINFQALGNGTRGQWLDIDVPMWQDTY